MDDLSTFDVNTGTDSGGPTDFVSTDTGATGGAGDLTDFAGNFTPLATLASFAGSGTAGTPLAMSSAGAMGAMPSVVATGAGVLVSLGSKLAQMFGRAAGSFTINGVKGSMAMLWPYVRKYGPIAVATALGITVEALGSLLMHAPMHRKHRRRGISARDVRTTRRVVGFVNRISQDIGCVHRPHFTRHRRRRYH